MSKQTLRGAKELGEAVELTPRQMFHLLHAGEIKCALKKGRTWYANREALLREFGAVDRPQES